MNPTLQPQANFTVVRQIANHLDTDTNYVQAVIRNAYTDAIIDTIQLTDKGSQRFKKDWQVPADSSGQGFYISIVTSVYTDSGYTSKNPNYGDEENTYLVQERVRLIGAGGGVDSFTLRRIIGEELDKRPVSLEALQNALQSLERNVAALPKESFTDRTDELLGAIKDNKPKKANFAPVLEAIGKVHQSVEDKPVTKPTDLYQLERKVDVLKEALDLTLPKMTALLQSNPEEVVKLLGPDVTKKLEELVKNTTFSIAPSTAKMNPSDTQSEKPKPVPFDLKKLAL